MIKSLALNMVTYNEAHRIADTLAKVAPLVDEMVIVDQSSTDGTADICRGLGASVSVDPPFGHGDASRQRCLDATQSDWVLSLDADEECSDEFVADLRGLDQHKAIRLKIGLKVAGEFVCVGRSVYRLFRRNDYYYTGVVHTAAFPKVPLTPSMGCFLLPYTAIWDKKSWSELLEGFEQYERLGGRAIHALGDLGWLHLARSLDLSGEDLDKMTRHERHALGFKPEGDPVGAKYASR